MTGIPTTPVPERIAAPLRELYAAEIDILDMFAQRDTDTETDRPPVRIVDTGGFERYSFLALEADARPSRELYEVLALEADAGPDMDPHGTLYLLITNDDSSGLATSPAEIGNWIVSIRDATDGAEAESIAEGEAQNFAIAYRRAWVNLLRARRN
ncbi:hypothetical protein [Nocardia tengchongensis]|uniref:hypothetical protein n=1 Tax=Nocardia tengchongensis TaxID=2055889 RepID=UPI00361D843A